jgi:hypothetical protein
MAALPLCAAFLGCNHPAPAAASAAGQGALRLASTDADEGPVDDPAREALAGSAQGRPTHLEVRCEPLDGDVPVCEADMSLGDYCPEVEAFAEAEYDAGRPTMVLGGVTGRGADLCGRTICAPQEPVPCGAEVEISKALEDLHLETAEFDEVEQVFDDAFDLETCLAERAVREDGGLRVGEEVRFRVCVGGAGVLRACALTSDSAENPCIRRAFGCLAATAIPPGAPLGAFQRSYYVCAWVDDDADEEPGRTGCDD